MTRPLALGLLCAATLACAGGESAPDGDRAVLRLDPRIDALLATGAELERLATGFSWLEGPAWDVAAGRLLFSDIPRNSIYRWSETSGPELHLTPSGYTGDAPFTGREPGSNGLLFDAEGRLVSCEHGDRRISRLEPDGSKTTLADRYEGKRLNSPNDAVYDSNGNLYFTDPPFGLPGAFDDPAKELEHNGVYRLSVDGQLALIIGDIGAPNGIALSPDGKTLYVTDVDRQRPAWLAYDLGADGIVTNGRVLVDGEPFGKWGSGAPDGLAVDRDGNLYGAGPGGVHVFAPDGTHLGTIETGVATSNCAWGEDGTVLYITASDSLFRIRTSTIGLGWTGPDAGADQRQSP